MDEELARLLAYSDDRETHEWSRIQAGVFSHLLRSALSGAADVNADGDIEYSEVAAFVSAAGADLDRIGRQFNTFAWPPARERDAVLLDVGAEPRLREVRLERSLGGRMFLETESGTRWAEFNKAREAPLSLFVPAGIGYFLRGGNLEAVIPAGPTAIEVDALSRAWSALVDRGAMDMAFETSLFFVPFSESYYRGFVAQRPHLVSVTFRRSPEEPSSSSASMGVESARARRAAIPSATAFRLR